MTISPVAPSALEMETAAAAATAVRHASDLEDLAVSIREPNHIKTVSLQIRQDSSIFSPRICVFRYLQDSCWLLVSGYWSLVIGLWSLASSFWPLASGFWLLASGFWLLAASGAGQPERLSQR